MNKTVGSHFEALRRTVELRPHDPDLYDDSEIVVESSLDEDGVLKKVQTVKTPVNRYKGVRWQDFSMDSLALAGAASGLPVSMLKADALTDSENVASKVAVVDADALYKIEDKNNVSAE